MREVLFGSRELTEYYRKSMALIHQHKLYQPYRLEVSETEAVLVLFNCFRYRRNKETGLFSAEYFDLTSAQWKKARTTRRTGSKVYTCYTRFQGDTCPDINCLSSKKYLLEYACDRMLRRVKKAVDINTFYTRFDLNRTPGKRRLTLKQVDEIISKYICRGLIMKNTFNHVKKITKWLWSDFFDRSLISLIGRIESPDGINIVNCIYYQRRVNAIKKIAAEYPNLLPLLSRIPPKHWHDPNLFSFDYWVNVKEQPAYINVLTGTELSQLSQKAQWRWLKKQSPLIVRVWKGNNLPDSLLRHGIAGKIPVCIIRTVIRYHDIFYDFNENETAVTRLFIRYMSELWQKDGISALRHYLECSSKAQLYQVRDYWINAENRPGVPGSWESLSARSETWHTLLLARQRQIQDFAYKKLLASRWETPLSSHTIDDITFTALNTGQALSDEGERMHHCIFTYTKKCLDKRYLVFSTQYYHHKKIRYATLGLVRDVYSRNWQVEQHWGPCNSQIPEKVQRAGHMLCQFINQSQSRC